MKIKNIEIKNFRKFTHLGVEFDENMTVIAALNGSGKSAVLDAVKASLWAFVRRIDAASGASGSKPVGIHVDDVTLLEINEQMEPQIPSVINIKFIDDQSWTISREKTAPRTNTIYKNAKTADDLAKTLQKKVRSSDDRATSLPVIGFYGTGRLWNQKQFTSSRSKLDDSFFSRTYGYLDCLDEASSFKYFAQWFQWLFESHREEQIRAIEANKTVFETKFQPYILAIQNAISRVIESETSWGKIEYSTTKKDVVLYHKDHGELKLSQLSDGVRNAVALVADIAYRCVKLNNQYKEKAPLLSEGIVLIDEVDMHLHPSWQQRILRQLQQAFPNLQFIVTTHSPQVLSTVPKECIRVLGTNAEGKDIAAIPLAASYGEPSNDVLQAIMHVDPQPPVPEKALLNELTSLVDQGEYQSQRAEQLLSDLKQTLNDQHPQILKIERSIRRQEALKR